MSDIDIYILLAFDLHICLSKGQLSENMTKGDRFVDSDELEEALHRLVAEKILIKDTDRTPTLFYRLTFFGIVVVAAAKREEIRRSRLHEKNAMCTAKGTARAIFLTDSASERRAGKKKPIF
jgi:hypothetical protein